MTVISKSLVFFFSVWGLEFSKITEFQSDAILHLNYIEDSGQREIVAVFSV